MKKNRIIGIMSILIIGIFTVTLLATPTANDAERNLRTNWMKKNRGDRILSIEKNKSVNYGRPWKYKKGYDSQRRVIMRYSFPYMVKVKRHNEVMSSKVDVIYVSVGNGPWKYDRLLVGDMIRQGGAKGKEAPSIAVRNKLFSRYMMKENYMRTEYPNSVKMPPKTIMQITMQQLNFVDRGERYWYEYKMFFDVIDNDGKKFTCRNIKATLIKNSGQPWKYFNVGGGAFSKCKPK